MPAPETTTIPWSPYDLAMPGGQRAALPDARAAFGGLRRRRGADAGLLDSFRDVIVVVSSSRGGSTLAGELLRRGTGLVHLRAEINPLFVAAGLEPPEARTAALAEELSVDVGRPAATLPPEEVDDFAATVAWRLVAQWPAAGIDPDAAAGWVHRTLAELAAADPAWEPPRFPDRAAFHLRLLAHAREAHPDVDPWYYDLPAGAVSAAFPGVEPPDGPPGPALVEMPPFVLVGPWRRAGPADAAASPLVLSTPRNAFRLSFLRELFPAARLRVVHLTRNPAAAVNGLIDGWCHRGFFNCAVERPLRIAGYSDVFPWWGTTWWNYDFWPGWEDWTEAPLARVCAEQWRTHHDAVLAFLEKEPVDSFRLGFEDVTGPDPERARAFAALAAWLGDVDGVEGLAGLRLPPLMATARPRPRRWEQRRELLVPALADEPVADLAARLGYDDPGTWR